MKSFSLDDELDHFPNNWHFRSSFQNAKKEQGISYRTEEIYFGVEVTLKLF